MSFITSNAGQKVTSAKIEEIVAPEPAQIAVSD
jgi:hypothetical protein